MKRAALVIGAGLGLFALTAPGAAAATGGTVPLDCDNGESYVVAVNGNGEYTPGRVVDSTEVLVPIRFGNFYFRATLPDGTVIEDVQPGSEYKGAVAARNPRETVSCTYSQTHTVTAEDPDEDFPVGTVLYFEGEVTGYLSGH